MPEPVVVKSKPWYESIGTWGVVIGVLGTILGFFNIVVAPEVQATLTQGVAQVATGFSSQDWGAVLSGIVSLGGAIIALVGRKQADQQVHFVTPFTYTLAPTALAQPASVNTPASPPKPSTG